MMCARNSVHDLMLCISENLNEEYRKSITMSGKIKKKTLFFQKYTLYIYIYATCTRAGVRHGSFIFMCLVFNAKLTLFVMYTVIYIVIKRLKKANFISN